MKIGLVLAQTPGYSETFFLSKIKGLQNNGVEISLYVQTQQTDFDLCPVYKSPKVSANPIMQSYYFLNEMMFLLPYISRVRRFISLEKKEGTRGIDLLKKIYLNTHIIKAKVDWLHFGFATQSLGRETLAKAIGCKMTVSIRGFDIAVYPVKNPGCYTRLWKHVDKIHSISDDLTKLANKHGLPEHIPVIKITPAIDVNLFYPNYRTKSSNETLIFMTTGRLHWKKGFTPTIEALAILKDGGLKFMYNIIGEGEEDEAIAYAIYNLGLTENVRFLGKISHKDIREELKKADFYLQYSVQEGFCNSVLEAQAVGTLCVVSDAEGLTENVLHGETGWVVPRNSPQLLADQITKVLSMAEAEKIKISRNAVVRVKAEFNIDKQDNEFTSFYSI